MPGTSAARDGPASSLSTPDWSASVGWVPAADGLTGGLQVRILRADVVSIWPWWRRHQSGDSFWRLYRHDADGAWLGLPGGATVALPAGQAVLVPAGSPFTCHAAPGIRQLYIHFTVMMPEVLTRRCFPRPLTVGQEPFLEGLLADLVRNWATARRGPGLLLRLQAAVQAALAPVLDGLPADRAAPLRAMLDGTHPLASLQAFIREHLARPLSVADLVAATGIHRNRLARLCRTHLEGSPNQLIVRERLAAAEDRLAHTVQTIDDIAAACGFCNRFYFSRVFARRHGCGPDAWRRRKKPLAGMPGRSHVLQFGD